MNIAWVTVVVGGASSTVPHRLDDRRGLIQQRSFTDGIGYQVELARATEKLRAWRSSLEILEDLVRLEQLRKAVLEGNRRSWRALMLQHAGPMPAPLEPVQLHARVPVHAPPRARARGSQLEIRNFARRP